MLYTGYTKTELESLLILLDKIQVPYEVLMDDGQAAERTRQRGDASILRVDIPDEALATIAPEHYPELERYRIYPHMVDMPLEYFAPPAAGEGPSATATKTNSFVKWITLAMAIGMILIAFASIQQ
jgi:hypothetical protein